MDETQQPAENTVSLVKMNEIPRPVETTVSPAKIEANRRNALKSTGPRTERGKANVRFNALKHGFLSKQVVISSKRIGEDAKEFEALLERLMEHYDPANVAEEVQVEMIAVCLWRDRRLLRCEVEEAGRARAAKEPNPAPEDKDPDPAGILRLLRKAETEIDKEGDFSPETKSSVASLFGWEVPQEGNMKEIYRKQEEILRDIRKMIHNLESMDQEGGQREEALVADAYSIPGTEALDRLLRYQALNDRRLHRALTQLERLQRQRKGEYVPAPVKVSVEGVQ